MYNSKLLLGCPLSSQILKTHTNAPTIPVPIYTLRKNTAKMCYSVHYVVDCTECGYRQSLGRPFRVLCDLAMQHKHCGRHDIYENQDQHVCASCLQAQREREEKQRKEAEKKKREEEAAAAKKNEDEIQVRNIMAQLARFRK